MNKMNLYLVTTKTQSSNDVEIPYGTRGKVIGIKIDDDEAWFLLEFENGEKLWYIQYLVDNE